MIQNAFNNQFSNSNLCKDHKNKFNKPLKQFFFRFSISSLFPFHFSSYRTIMKLPNCFNLLTRVLWIFFGSKIQINSTSLYFSHYSHVHSHIHKFLWPRVCVSTAHCCFIDFSHADCQTQRTWAEKENCVIKFEHFFSLNFS
jgi:hypothetical protein